MRTGLVGRWGGADVSGKVYADASAPPLMTMQPAAAAAASLSADVAAACVMSQQQSRLACNDACV